jgi:hypothetical protein
MIGKATLNHQPLQSMGEALQATDRWDEHLPECRI